MQAVFYKGSTVIHTSKHGEVCVVIFEILKINCVSIKVCQDPALLFCHKALILILKIHISRMFSYLFAGLDLGPLSEFFSCKLEQYVSP